ncbi:MAG: Mannitol dehydrogenase domain [Thermoleophilia bacterium]|nr:Mannitol dehydrogenase domain [Thermoleophilia bacterium]
MPFSDQPPFPDRPAPAPRYDRSALVPSIVHIGVGGFHRAHQAVYLDDLAATGATGWGTVGVCLRSPETARALEPNDYLYTVVECGPDHEEERPVGVMTRCLFAPDERDAVLDALCSPTTRLVTLTITGTAYHVDEDSRRFDATADEIVADLAEPTRPNSTFGYLAEALDRRRRAGTAPFTVLSCDNMQDSAAAAHIALCAYAHLRDPGLARWIDANVAFPASVVDRITPSTTADHPLVTEPFRQWIIEDHFCNGRPPLDRVGVQFVDDVRPYKVAKTRMLNGSHCAVGYLGTLAGYRTTADAMQDPSMRRFLDAMMAEEIVPQLPEARGLDLASYREQLLERFANPAIADPLSRLCRRGSTKMPAYLLPSLRAARRAGHEAPLLTLALAGWLTYLGGPEAAGMEIDVVDAHADELTRRARLDGYSPRPVLAIRGIFGDLLDDTDLVTRLDAAMRALRERGVRAVLAESVGPAVGAAA